MNLDQMILFGFSNLSLFYSFTNAERARTARDHKKTIAKWGISPNGPLPATLRPPIGANPSTRGFAGGRNVVERSERYASEAKPDEPKDQK
jgi:hypothetical protein